MKNPAGDYFENNLLRPDQATWLMSTLAALHQRSLRVEELARECIPPITWTTFTELAQRVGFEVSLARVSGLPRNLPVAIEIVTPAQASSGAGLLGQDQESPLNWIVLIGVEGDHILFLDKAHAEVQRLPTEELHASFSGSVLKFTPVTAVAEDPDEHSRAGEERRFGFGWFVPELLKHKSIWREILFASLVLQILALAFPLFTQAIIDKVVVHRANSTLVALTVGMALFIGFTTALTWVRQYLILHTGNRVDAVLGSAVFEHLFKLPPSYFQHRPTGIVAARLQGVETIREFVSSAAITLILDVPSLLVFVAIMFWYSASLTWLVMGILVLIVAASAVVAPIFQKRLNEQFLRGAAIQAFATEYVAGLETVKSLQMEPQLNRQYRIHLASFLRASLKTRQLGNTYGVTASALEQLMGLLVLAFGAHMVMGSTNFTIGMLVAFQMFASRLSQPMLRMVGLWQQFQQANIAVARLGDIMNAPIETYSLVGARVQSSGGAIQIDNLAFRYSDNHPLLFEGFDLSVPAGKLIVITGPSGSGKSTLARLLQGFYRPTQGAIRVDGIDISHLSANELRSNFGVVPQEITLFTGTILENLRMANPFASFDQIVAACKMAEIHTSIEALPAGYETRIGERGAGLSGGQRQRIAIARALLKGPKVLVFDEATSSIDGPSAEQIGRTIDALKGRVTMLFIAHQLPRTLHADQVIRLGDKLTIMPPRPDYGAASTVSAGERQ